MSSQSFIEMTIDCYGVKWSWLRRKMQGLGAISNQIGMLKRYDIKKNTGVVQHTERDAGF